MKVQLFSFLFITIIISACKHTFQYTERKASLIQINSDSLKLYDSSVHYLILPYKQQLDSQMNAVIGKTNFPLTKTKPESTLGNLLCDAAVWYATQHYGKPIDICVMNYGGIRIPAIEAGDITVGKMYELMPFDNMIDVLEIKGSQVNELLQLVAAADGWPVWGVRMQIENKKAVDILIGGQPLDTTKVYTLVTSDYVANGGDNAGMLKKSTKRTGLNHLLRESLIEYVKHIQTLNIQLDGRITVKP